MDRRRPSRVTLTAAALIVIASLVALVALPLFVSTRITRLRAEIDQRAEPARNDLNEVNYQLSRQIASLSRHVLTAKPEETAEYRQSVTEQELAMRSLAAEMPDLDHNCVARFNELSIQARRWHAVVEQSLADSSDNSPLAASRLAYEADYPSVIEAVYRLDDAIGAYQSANRSAAARWTDLQVRVSAALAVLALVAAATVLWMVGRLRTLASELARESDERMAALQAERQTRHTAESLLRSRDEILGVVSHDLRSPLTTITLSTQLLEGSTPDEQSEHVETILATTRRMQRLIQDLLDASRIENSSLSILHEEIEPGGVAGEVAAAHVPIAEEKHLHFETAFDPQLPKISGDHDRLVQALGNLLGNAIKFTPEEGTVRFTVNSRDGHVRFAVEDSGPGIAPSDLPHLFEPFWQSKKTAHLGAGLGLKITRAIAEAHGGSVQVTNRDAGGACFVFDVPVAPES